MQIGGFQKLTLLDYPGQMACIVFTSGCNFCCPFCHNAGLIRPGGAKSQILVSEIMDYLEKRKGLLEGVVLSGGEPLMQPDVREFLLNVRQMGYRVKLDTNGSFPETLEALLEEGLIDYAAMDIKHCREAYALAAGRGCEDILPKIEQSISLLKKGKISFEFRTTLVKGIHKESDIEKIASWIAGDAPFYLQSYVDSGDVLSPQNLEAFSGETLRRMLFLAQKYCPNVELRGI